MTDSALPRLHFSVRIPWHDTGWDGRVCKDPIANHSCLALKNVRDNRRDEEETKSGGARWDGLPENQLPPCVLERGGWLAPFPLIRHRHHPYAKTKSPTHIHLRESAIEVPARAAMGIPFRWMRRDEAQAIAEMWRIEYDPHLETAADRVLERAGKTWRPDWVQDHRNQLHLLDAFFSAAKPEESLLFAYAKRVPLIEGEQELQPRRVLIGATTITGLGPTSMWEEDRAGPLSAAQWERAIHHNLRLSERGGKSSQLWNWKDGVLLPYQRLLANRDLAGEDFSRFVAAVPSHLVSPQFSYATEHVTNDGAVEALVELRRATAEVSPFVAGNWQQQIAWIDEKLSLVWKWRGAYPGIGAALTAAGIPGGVTAALTVLDETQNGDPWPTILAALTEAASGVGPLKRVVSPAAARTVHMLSEERLSLLKLFSRMDLTVDQTRRMFTPEGRHAAGYSAISDSDILENPYVVYEIDRMAANPVALSVVDRGAMCLSGDDKLPAPVNDSVDARRVRAAMVTQLEVAADQGHTLKPQAELLALVSDISLEPPCCPTSDLVNAIRNDLPPEVVPVQLADGQPAWQLGRLGAVSDVIRNQVEVRVRRGRPHEVKTDWAAAVDRVIGSSPEPDDREELAARKEKAHALEVMATSRFTVLVGPAGTGKTTLIRALSDLPDISQAGLLLLAPTGKAVVQLTEKVGQPASTLAAFLRRYNRYDIETGRYRLAGDGCRQSVGTVIIDEASMLTEEMLAAVLESLVGVKRLILVGDHRQLPPIGAGRPFRDAIELCRERRTGYAPLKTTRRQAGGGDDLLLAAWFATDSVGEVLDDQVWARAGRGDSERVELISWKTEAELHAAVQGVLSKLFGVEPGDEDSLKTSLGAKRSGEWINFPNEDPAASVNSWQLLSPIRYREGGVVGLNDMVRDRYRPLAVRRASGWGATTARPEGAYRLTNNDKVIVNRNIRRDGWRVSQREIGKNRLVANGEVGILHGPYVRGDTRKKPDRRHLYLSTQPGWRYSIWDGDFGDDSGDLLDLAYALTIHKSQGSQFNVTLVVIPCPCRLLSPELIYTALTRQTDKVVILHQGDLAELRRFANPAASETAARLTALFRSPDPVEIHGRERPLDANLVHRARRGHLVRTKSEVIVADALYSSDVPYRYEKWCHLDDGGPDVLPDFTIEDDATGELVIWEHLGLLDSETYRYKWERKKARYMAAGILPWEDGGGGRGRLVVTEERGGIDSKEIAELVEAVFG